MLLHSKGNHQQEKKKRQPSEWEKIFANETTEKALISKIYKKRKKIQSKKWADLNRHFSKETYR